MLHAIVGCVPICVCSSSLGSGRSDEKGKGFIGRRKKEGKPEKKKEEIPKPIDKEKKERKKQPTLSRVTTLTLILDPPLLHLASNNRNWIRHALASLPTGPMSLPPQIHWSPQTQTNVPSDESTLEIEADVDHWQVPIQRQ